MRVAQARIVHGGTAALVRYRGIKVYHLLAKNKKMNEPKNRRNVILVLYLINVTDFVPRSWLRASGCPLSLLNKFLGGFIELLEAGLLFGRKKNNKKN